MDICVMSFQPLVFGEGPTTTAISLSTSWQINDRHNRLTGVPLHVEIRTMALRLSSQRGECIPDLLQWDMR